jgi:hypothetical protein
MTNAISKPCDNLNAPYVERETFSNKFMADKDTLECPKADGEYLHDLFFKTDFSLKEGDVYKENDLFKKI